MRLHRFLGPFFFEGPQEEIEDLSLVHQIKRVLRLKEGDRIILGNMKGKEATCEIVEIEEFSIKVAIGEMRDIADQLKEISLFCSILKGSSMDLVVQKATEVGVSRIVPIVCARTVKRDIRQNRLKKIIRESSEQSGRGTVPDILSPISFQEAVTSFSGSCMVLFDPLGEKLEPCQQKPSLKEHVGVFVGPEGGFTPEELNLARESLVLVRSLGPLVLRAETAAIIGSYVALSL